MSRIVPNWMRITLLAAAAYNLIWGCWVVLYPNGLFDLLQVSAPTYPPIWQALGMIVGLYGVGYAIASRDPVRHWPIVLVGLLGKIFGPIGFIWSLQNGSLPATFFWQILPNDLIWWLPFSAILYYVFRETSGPKSVQACCNETEADPIRVIQSQLGQTVIEASSKRPLMLVFLRHGGCTFCRQTLSDLQDHRDEILGLGVDVALVHMGSPMEGTTMLSNYELDFFHRFSDPNCKLYHRFGFERGNFNQLFSLPVIWRGLKAGILGGHGIGKPQGDSFQLPGVVVMYHEKAILAFPAKDASERYDYLDIARRARAIADNLSPQSSKRQPALS